MGIARAGAVLSDICLTHFNVHDMTDEIRDWTGKLRLNFVETEDERSHFDAGSKPQLRNIIKMVDVYVRAVCPYN
jgi:hypothetical protein